MDIIYHQLNPDQEEIPYDLLLLADPSKPAVDQYIRRGHVYIASVSDQLAGLFVLIPTRPFTIEIVNIAVSEPLQNQGIGTKLVLKAIETAKQLGALTVEIGTGNSSLQQLRLYQRCGFRIVGVDPDFFVKHYDEKIMENGIHCRDMIRLRLEL